VTPIFYDMRCLGMAALGLVLLPVGCNRSNDPPAAPPVHQSDAMRASFHALSASPPCSTYRNRRHVAVADSQTFRTALSQALPGDLIELAPGFYPSFAVTRSGVESAPIVLCGPRSAVIENGNRDSYSALRADYWIMSGFTVHGGLFGLAVQGGNHNMLDGIEVYDIGQEAIQFSLFSSDNTLQNSHIHDTGRTIPMYGEGVYIGTSDTRWCVMTRCQTDTSDSNRVLYNTIGPNVTAEHVDVKEGTTGGVILGNVFDGAGQVLVPDMTYSLLAIKGNRYLVTDNRLSHAVRDGVLGFVDRPGWGNDNVYRRNIVDVGNTGYGFNLSGGNGNIVGCDNTVTGAESGFATVACR
jgi:hypothetical protein